MPLRVTATPRKGWRVMLAISDPLQRAVMTALLRDAGCRVVAVKSGIHLLRRLSVAILEEDPRRRPALIIADLQLPGCSGLSILEGLRALSWETPFFLLVGDNSAAIARRAFAVGATRVFDQPASLAEVHAAALTYLLARSPHLAGAALRRARPSC